MDLFKTRTILSIKEASFLPKVFLYYLILVPIQSVFKQKKVKASFWAKTHFGLFCLFIPKVFSKSEL